MGKCRPLSITPQAVAGSSHIGTCGEFVTAVSSTTMADLERHYNNVS